MAAPLLVAVSAQINVNEEICDKGRIFLFFFDAAVIQNLQHAWLTCNRYSNMAC